MEFSHLDYKEKACKDSLNKLNETITPDSREKLDKLHIGIDYMEFSCLDYEGEAYKDSLNKLNEAITPAYRKKLDKLSAEYGLKVYDENFFKKHPGHKEIIVYAEYLWAVSIHEDFKEDSGSCVRGAGFYVWVLESKRHSKPHKRLIITPPTRFQGSVTWERSVPKVKSYLIEKGICAGYNHGFMD